MRHPFIITICILLSLLAASCGSESNGNSCVGDYDQTALFQHMADAVIIPAFGGSQTRIADMLDKVNTFSNDRNSGNLNLLRESFRQAYLSYQDISYFRFGPAESAQMNTRMNNYPVNAALLEANIAAGQYSLENFDNYYSGFPALDYLLYGLANDDAAILDIYNGGNGDAYVQYLQDVCTVLKSTIDNIVAGWADYRSTFINNTGTADGSALSLLVNSLNQQYEDTRRDKLGIPAGFQELNAPAFPERVEAYYSGFSLDLLERSVSAAQTYFNGDNGEGLDDYLQATGIEKEGQTLDKIINQGFQESLQKLADIPESLSQSITDGHSSVQDAYIPLGNLVVELKTDMPSALCVSITYVDNPSDSD